MEKVHPLIMERRSPVAFDPKAVDLELVQVLFEAASWAPSARNAQPWRFLFATRGTSDYELFIDLMDEYNKLWARTAPLLVLSMGQVVSTYKNRPNRLAFYETGMAVANLLLQATHMGLCVHQLSGYNLERAKEELVIPTRYEPAAMMAIGYKGDPSRLPAEVAAWEERERERNEISSFLLAGKCKQD